MQAIPSGEKSLGVRRAIEGDFCRKVSRLITSMKRIQSMRLESGEESWNLENPGLKHGQDNAK